MADEYKDDEYQFREEGDGLDLDENTSFTSKAMGPTPARIVLTVIGVALVALFVYKILAGFFHSKKEPSHIVKVPKTSQVVKAPPKLMPQHVPVITPVPQGSAKPSKIMLEKIARLEADLIANQNKLRHSIKNTQDVKGDVRALLSKMDNLNNTVMLLTEELKAQEAQLKKLKKKPKSKKRYVKRMLPRTTYVIQAIIPGRAWLRSSEGETLTVRIGSRLSGFGKVKLIDAEQGQVLMSSGKRLMFSPNES